MTSRAYPDPRSAADAYIADLEAQLKDERLRHRRTRERLVACSKKLAQIADVVTDDEDYGGY